MVKGAVPPPATTVTSPSQTPLQEIGVLIVVDAVITGGSVMVTELVTVHNLASVTVTL